MDRADFAAPHQPDVPVRGDEVSLAVAGNPGAGPGVVGLAAKPGQLAVRTRHEFDDRRADPAAFGVVAPRDSSPCLGSMVRIGLPAGCSMLTTSAPRSPSREAVSAPEY